MKATVVDLRRRTREIIAALDRGESVTITYRGKEKGTIVPKRKRKRMPAADHPAVGMWKDREDLKDPSAWVRGIRRSRVHGL
ncbi:MAG: type II toxin-antitoxin system prevent-host-death family antitoxin [Planctomycetota bacterium]|jgi:prevent-host-death family protein